VANEGYFGLGLEGNLRHVIQIDFQRNAGTVD
jgi:hypothetical protein